MSLERFALVVTAIIAVLASFASADCYYGNHTSRNAGLNDTDTYTPCNSNSSGASMCCNSLDGDLCEPVSTSNPSAALCWNQGTNLLWRESCTDRSWSSVNCVKLFMNVSDSDITITNCSASGLGPGYCYGNGNLGCCQAGEAVFIDPSTGEQVSTNPDGNSNSTSTPSNTSPATKHGLSTGAIVGIAVGVALGVIALVLIVMFCVKRKRSRRNAVQPYLDNSASPVESTQYHSPMYRKPPVEAGSYPVSEYRGHNRQLELQELPAKSSSRDLIELGS